MRLVLFAHPPSLPSQSMTRFAQGLLVALRERGHTAELRTSPDVLRRPQPQSQALGKWLGYADQYLLFPHQARRAMAADPADTLYVLCDQALGPWLPLVANRPHVVHCHDLLALQSALGEWPENPTRWSGRVYQRYIRSGFRQARHFISVSEHTRSELHRVGQVAPAISEVVYNGLNPAYVPMAAPEAERVLHAAGLVPGPQRMLLHVGGSQWYKNTAALVRLYGHYARAVEHPLPLWMVSPPATAGVQAELARLPAGAEVRFLGGLSDEALCALYSLARAFLFPSLAEGFGWPIAEALACGCPVVTTGEAPMTEVGGDAAHYLPRLKPGDDRDGWAAAAAQTLLAVLGASPRETAHRREAGLRWVSRFDAGRVFDAYIGIYQRVLAFESAPAKAAVPQVSRRPG